MEFPGSTERTREVYTKGAHAKGVRTTTGIQCRQYQQKCSKLLISYFCRSWRA